MKNKLYFAVVSFLMVSILFTGCGNKKTKAKTETKPSQKQESTNQKSQKEFTSTDGMIRLKLMSDMEKVSEESTDTVQGTNTYFLRGEDTNLVIGDRDAGDTVLTEDTIRKEVSTDGFEVKNVETKTIDGVGTFYGATVVDTIENLNMMYYDIQHDQKIYSFILFQSEALDSAIVNEYFDMLQTLIFLK